MNILAPVSSLKTSETELLPFLTQYAIENGLPLAFWRLPDSDTRHLIISEAYQHPGADDLLEDFPTGFILAPFEYDKTRFFLPADFLFSFTNGELKTPENSLEHHSARWLQERLQSYVPKGLPPFASASAFPHPETGRDVFIGLIEKCIHEIEQGTFEKIVPSRYKKIALPENFDITRSFQKLCDTYPQALISFVTIPGVGSWLGASPEVLVSVENKSVFKTVALAGTKPYQPGVNIKSVAWTQKEIEEQALVERYVISCFKQVRLREYQEHGPKTVIAGNLMHLKSTFTVDMKATNFPRLGSVMLNLLHPTSAVCGMPLEPSLRFLQQHEGYERDFYAGYLGPVNVHHNINLFVNLRCMQIRQQYGILYAGAGVTIDSNPEEEWMETEMKFNTLLNVIF